MMKGKIMESRFYQSQEMDIEKVVYELEQAFIALGYQVQHIGNKEYMTVQIRKGSNIEAIVGMQAALTLMLRSVPEGVLAVLGQPQWIDKAAVGTAGMLFLWPLMLTAGMGVIRQVGLESELDAVVQRQQSDVRMGPIPPQMQAQWNASFSTNAPPYPGQASSGTPTPAVEEIPCPHCQEINEVGDRFCSHCGKSLTPQKKQCPQCKAEVKASATFCTQCSAPLSEDV